MNTPTLKTGEIAESLQQCGVAFHAAGCSKDQAMSKGNFFETLIGNPCFNGNYRSNAMNEIIKKKEYRAIYQIGTGRDSRQFEVRHIDHPPFAGWEYGLQLVPDGSNRYAVCIAVELEK